jgi:hypothetical protein
MMLGRLKYTAERPVPGPRASEAELAIENMKRYKLLSTVEVPSEMNWAAGRAVL